MSTLTWTTYAMPAASLGKENPLPDLKGAGDPHSEIAVDHTTISPEESKYMGWARVSTILPYTMQDGYNREKRTRQQLFFLEGVHPVEQAIEAGYEFYAIGCDAEERLSGWAETSSSCSSSGRAPRSATCSKSAFTGSPTRSPQPGGNGLR